MPRHSKDRHRRHVSHAIPASFSIWRVGNPMPLVVRHMLVLVEWEAVVFFHQEMDVVLLEFGWIGHRVVGDLLSQSVEEVVRRLVLRASLSHKRQSGLSSQYI